ncbi:MAG: hypothetical protein R3336_09230, partial [Phycisphaeraceae bacterium]|nr:hypothetical protein [Phycisphaeraceae bacterium]
GQTLMDYALFDAARAGFGRAVLVIRPDMQETFEQNVLPRAEAVIPTTLAYQALDDLPGDHTPPAGREKPWGTAHAVWCARGLINTPFAMINADDFYGRAAFATAAKFLTATGDREAAMVGYRLDRTLSDHGPVSRGICEVADGQLKDVQETHQLQRDGDTITGERDGEALTFTGDETVSMNFWLFPPSLFDDLEQSLDNFLTDHGDEPGAEHYLPPIITGLIDADELDVRVLRCEAEWFGVTFREDRPAVVDTLKELTDRGLYPRSWPDPQKDS